MNENILIRKWSEPERIVSAYFWYRETLNISPDVETPQEINWIIGEIDLKLKYIYIDKTNLYSLYSLVPNPQLGAGVSGNGQRHH